MKNKPFKEELLTNISHYFDEIYIYISNVMIAIDNELKYYGTAFMKWNKTADYSKPFKDKEMEERLCKAKIHGDIRFNVYFEETEDGYKKYLFINKTAITDFIISVDDITTIMRYYFRANRRTGGKAFNQKDKQNEFITILVSLFPNSIAKLYQGILSISMSEKKTRSISIEDGESFNQVNLDVGGCVEMASFFECLGKLL